MIKNKTIRIFLNALPIILMIALIPLFQNDYALAIIYAAIIAASFAIKYQEKDIVFFISGLIIMTLSELVFVSTGVEIFTRNSLFNKPAQFSARNWRKFHT
jgi:cell division protein FtsW (lipid II flippase)